MRLWNNYFHEIMRTQIVSAPIGTEFVSISPVHLIDIKIKHLCWMHIVTTKTSIMFAWCRWLNQKIFENIEIINGFNLINLRRSITKGYDAKLVLNKICVKLTKESAIKKTTVWFLMNIWFIKPNKLSGIHNKGM